MSDRVQQLPADADAEVDAEILACINPDNPRSFFLYAGAGSGKTYSLISALNSIREHHGQRLRATGRKIAVITFTNAASEEIGRRIDDDPLFVIKTIHSFCWQIIKPLQADIQKWLIATLPDEVAELIRLEERGRKGTAASTARLRSIESKKKELEWLSKPRTFSYSPNGDNIGKGALSHADVIKIASDFLEQKTSMQQIIISNYPLIFIDESQDTNKRLMTALLAVEKEKRGVFALGLFGDMMQRIYSDGLATLAPPDDGNWATPAKRLNRRSPNRVVELGNAIRSDIDEVIQHPIEGAKEGIIRLFIADSKLEDKPAFEASVRQQMANFTGEADWIDTSKLKQLMLEHSMAAERMGFAAMFNALRKDNRRSTSLMDGTLPAVRFFSAGVLPLWEHWQANRGFQIMSHLSAMKCPLLLQSRLPSASDNLSPLENLNAKVTACCEFLDGTAEATFADVLTKFGEAKIFAVPDSLAGFVGVDADTDTEEDDDDNDQISALANFLETPFSQIKAFSDYVAGDASFDTHQGVKGLEFDHVQVVVDDEAANGFMFSYERLFDVKPLSKREINLREEGNDTSIERTSRLLYVTCTRAKKTLAVIAYTEDKEKLAVNAERKGWFQRAEIMIS